MTNLEDRMTNNPNMAFCELCQYYFSDHCPEECPSQKVIINWLLQDAPILSPEEQEYLSAVVKPFKGKVSFITKRFNPWKTYGYSSDFYIEIDYNKHSRYINLPITDELKYDAMEVDKKYTLEELSL